MRDFLFYADALLILVLATVTVTSRHLFHSALCLLGTLLGTTVLFVLLGAEIVALAQILVYVGGILVFVLYSVFLTSDMGRRMRPLVPWQVVVGMVCSALVFGVLAGTLWQVGQKASVGPAPKVLQSLSHLGARLLMPTADGFLLPFEIISIVLLAALVGALAIVRGLPKQESRS
jgi:NADH-quinone oxidoreductase subunit J